jgi:hypothetical protein
MPWHGSNTLHLLRLCRLAVRLAHRRCAPPLPSLVLEGRLERTARSRCCSSRGCRTLWRLSSQDMRDWLRDWPALALACGLPLGNDGCPRIPCPSKPRKRGKSAGAPLPEALSVLTVLTALRRRLIGARDLIIDSAPILAWHRADPDAAFGHAPAQLCWLLVASVRQNWPVRTLHAVSCSLPIPQRKSIISSIHLLIFTKGERLLCRGFSSFSSG